MDKETIFKMIIAAYIALTISNACDNEPLSKQELDYLEYESDRMSDFYSR